MCGLAGSVNNTFDCEIVKKNMLHRGPDEQGEYTSGNVELYHLRLAILDITCGKQPMHIGEKYTIIFNGEIYNHQEIRKQYNIKGHTNSDTETLLLLYEKFGSGMLNLLDGMFVFVIHDKVKNILFAARDRAGKKPLYYYKSEGKFLFASELNCLKALMPLQMEESNFYHYLRLGSFYREQTPYKNVNELASGTFLTVDCSSLAISKTRWWNIHEFYLKDSGDSLEESIQKTNIFLHTAIKRRLESSDLEVASFLSGGIDSGLITAIATEYTSNLKTFTVSFSGEYNEAPLAKLVAEKYHTSHHEIQISFANLKNDLENIISNYGEPFFDSSAIPSYYICKEAKKNVTVILNGDGADELFGGYRRYVPFAKYDFFKKNAGLKTAATFLKNILPASENKRSKYDYLYRLISMASKSHLEIYLSAGVDIIEDNEKYILDPGFDYLEQIKIDFDMIASSPLSGLKKIMNLDFDTNLFSDLLVKMDIATMANSLEGRSPFLSKELMEYAPCMKDKFKINGSTTKVLLRQLAKKYLPANLINQPKRGFEVPLKSWIEGELRDIVFDHILSSNVLYKHFLKKEFVEKLLADKIKISGEKRAKILWTILSMEIWYKKIFLQTKVP
ncbi:MAG: asparagine synthase (glutamine-hydrolyzing) [Ginsengibacter sp.]